MLTQASPEKLTYAKFVTLLAEEQPGLVELSRFLSQGIAFYTPILTRIDYPRQQDSPKTTVTSKFDAGRDYTELPSECCGRVIFIEDINAPLMEQFGLKLDLDPFFFAGHIAAEAEDAMNQLLGSVQGRLPSHIARKTTCNISYKQIIDLGDIDPLEYERHHRTLLTQANIRRDAECLPYTRGQRQLATLSRRCSISMIKKSETWICLVLVDPDVSALTERTHQLGLASIIECKHLHRSFYPDQPPSYSSFLSAEKQFGYNKKSSRERLVEFFELDPPGFNRSNPTMLGMCYYPLKFAIAELVGHVKLVIRYAHGYSRGIENSINQINDINLYVLDGWRSRSYRSLSRYKYLTEFISSWLPDEPEPQAYTDLLKDMYDLSLQTQDLGRALEQKMQLVTTMVQLFDTRRSIAEAVNVKRVTYIALVFVPLSWLASLFSMADDFAPGGSKFWIYFVTGLPLVAAILSMTTLPVDRFWSQGVLLFRLWFRNLLRNGVRDVEHGKKSN